MLNTVVDSRLTIQVVAAIIYGRDGRLLLAERPLDKHQGGKWEFPGGKVEKGESSQAALARELWEELGIDADTHTMQLFTKLEHRYPEKTVQLEFWQVHDFTGEPHGFEGQLIQWFNLDELNSLIFPAANQPVVDQLLQHH